MPAIRFNSNSGVRLLDCDHREMRELFHELNHSLSAGESMQQVSRLLASIRQITLTHFALEESMMQATDYPGLFLHRLEHQWLAEQNASVETRAKRFGIGVGDPLLNFMADSHLSHMHHHDSNYGNWLEKTPVPPASGANSNSDSHFPMA